MARDKDLSTATLEELRIALKKTTEEYDRNLEVGAFKTRNMRTAAWNRMINKADDNGVRLQKKIWYIENRIRELGGK